MKRPNPRRTLRAVERMAQHWRDEAERYRSAYESAPNSPNGRRFVQYCEFAAGCVAEAKRLRALRSARKRVTVRQVGGDDGFHWCVLIDGQVRFEGLDRDEAEWRAEHVRDEIARMEG